MRTGIRDLISGHRDDKINKKKLRIAFPPKMTYRQLEIKAPGAAPKGFVFEGRWRPIFWLLQSMICSIANFVGLLRLCLWSILCTFTFFNILLIVCNSVLLRIS